MSKICKPLKQSSSTLSLMVIGQWDETGVYWWWCGARHILLSNILNVLYAKYAIFFHHIQWHLCFAIGVGNENKPTAIPISTEMLAYETNYSKETDTASAKLIMECDNSEGMLSNWQIISFQIFHPIF